MKKMLGALIVLFVLVGCGGQDNVEKNDEETTDGSVVYDCQGEEVDVIFDNTVSPSIAKLTFTDRDHAPIILPNVEAASGAKYSQDGIVFWTHQDTAELTMDGTEKSLSCVYADNQKNDDKDINEEKMEDIVDENGNVVTEGCQVWFDGCNTCRAGEDGLPMVCTRKYCAPEAMQPARCLDDEIKSECEAAGGVWVDELNECMEDPEHMAGPGEK